MQTKKGGMMAYRNLYKRKDGSKYKNRKCIYDGIKFDSQKERDRYIYLKEAENKGLIKELRLQVKYELIPAVREDYVEHLKTKDKIKQRTLQLAITYTCDFQYIKDDELVVEDVKSNPKMLTKEYQLKKKMLFALKRIKIREVYKPNETI